MTHETKVVKPQKQYHARTCTAEQVGGGPVFVTFDAPGVGRSMRQRLGGFPIHCLEFPTVDVPAACDAEG